MAVPPSAVAETGSSEPFLEAALRQVEAQASFSVGEKDLVRKLSSAVDRSGGSMIRCLPVWEWFWQWRLEFGVFARVTSESLGHHWLISAGLDAERTDLSRCFHVAMGQNCFFEV